MVQFLEIFFITTELRFPPDFIFLSIPLFIIIIRLLVVKIIQSIDSENPLAGCFHDGHINGNWRVELEKLPFLVKEVLFLQVSEKFSSVCQKIRKSYPLSFVSIGLLHLIFILRVKTEMNRSRLRGRDEVRVKSSCFPLLVFGVEDLEDVFAEEFVVAVEVQTDGVFAAVLVVGIVVVLHGALPRSVVDVYVLVRGNPIKLKVLSVDLIAAVGRCVIHNDSEVVGVVLGKDGIEVVLDPELIIVEVAMSQNANR